MRFTCLIIALIIMACGHDKIAPKSSPQPQTFDLTAHPLNGWPSRDNCDALLWAGLASAAGGIVDLSEAEYAPGEMHRRPTNECYPAESASTISGDMLLGYMWGLWRSHDLAALQRLADYGLDHNWSMGIGPSSRVVLKYNDYVLLAKMIYVLSNGSDKRRFYQFDPIYFDVSADYEEHLQVLSILLYTEVNGSIDTASHNRLHALADAHPDDALFQVAWGRFTGDQTKATALLLADPVTYPSYVRGAEAYKDVYWRFAARIITGAQQ